MDLLNIIDRDTLLTVALPSVAVIVILYIMLRSTRPKARRRKFQRSNQRLNPNLTNLDNMDDDSEPAYRAARADDQFGDLPSITLNENDEAKASQADEPAPAYTVYQRRRTRSTATSEPEPVSFDDVDSEAPTTSQEDEIAVARPVRRNELLVVLNIISQDRPLPGESIIAAAEALDMHLGEMGIFQCYGPNGQRHGAVFGMANILEPGTFDVDHIDGFTTPGLTLFMQIPGPLDGMEAFALMLEKARELAKRLQAPVCDERHNMLTKQGAEHIFEQIKEHQRKLRLAQRQA